MKTEESKKNNYQYRNKNNSITKGKNKSVNNNKSSNKINVQDNNDSLDDAIKEALSNPGTVIYNVNLNNKKTTNINDSVKKKVNANENKESTKNPVAKPINNNKPVKNKNTSNLKSNNKPLQKPVSKSIKEDKQPDIKVFALGGLGCVGMNMYCVEVDDEILIMDCGILFGGDDDHGVNYIIPDFTYLEQNAHKIIGMFITHGHEDHIGAIPFLLKKIQIPYIYACGIAVCLINNKMQEYPGINYHIKEITPNDTYSFKNFSVSFFRTNHSIPDSLGIAIKTRLGYIVNTGDFKFDFSPVGHQSDFYKMTKLGEDGVYCLLSESTNANISSFSASEKKIGETLMNIFHQIDGRIICATFASNVYRVQQIIKASVDCNRKIVVFGHSMEKTIDAAIKLKYIDVSRDWILNSRDLKKIDTDHITILCTGSQGEPLAALSRIAQGTHKQIKLHPNDTIVYSSKPIPGNEQFINRNINMLVHAGARVIKNSPLTDTHTTGHASQNELRLMLAFMHPKYFVPIHGEYAMLKRHVEIAQGQGIPSKNCFVLSSGDVLSLNEKGAKHQKKVVPVNDVYLDSALSDVDSNILKERQKMADEGLVCATFFITNKRQIIDKPYITSRGFVTPTEKAKINDAVVKKAVDIYNGLNNMKTKLSISAFEKQIANQLFQYFFKVMDRKPLIVVTLKQVERK